MSKYNKFQHKWLNDSGIACCKVTGVWSLCYIETKGMFCAMCRIHNVAQPTNRSKIWNTEAVVRCRTETARGHFKEDTTLTTMHGQAVKSEQLKQKSYFTVKEKEINKNIDKSYLAVFKALYWITKEEVANLKSKSLLSLLEELGVKETESFSTRPEKILRGMIVLIGDTIKNKIVESIKQSKGFAILIDEVTDILNIQQLVTLVQYFDSNIGDCITTFLNTTDVLEHSPDSSPNAEAIFNCLCSVIEKENLQLENLKGFASDGASVMTGKYNGVAAKFKELESCKTMINIHCICHRLALACADTGDALKFIQEFEKTMLDLWTFFKNSPKWLKTYIKTTLEARNFDQMSKCQKKKLVCKVKKAVRTRWLSLQASIDSVYQKYVGLTHTLRSIKDPQSGPVAKGLLKK